MRQSTYVPGTSERFVTNCGVGPSTRGQGDSASMCVPGISRHKSIRTYVMFRPWTHTSDLGPKEACTGLTFVFLSRAKTLVDLMVEPMSFDRIGNLGNSSTMKAGLQEEVRLVEFAQSSRVTFADMGVFIAVARNQ